MTYYFLQTQRDDENAEVLRLDNVTFADIGWYTCVAANSLGSTSASAYLHVVEFFPPDETVIRAAPKNNEWYSYLVTFLMVFFIVALGIIMFVWKKYTAVSINGVWENIFLKSFYLSKNEDEETSTANGASQPMDEESYRCSTLCR